MYSFFITFSHLKHLYCVMFIPHRLFQRILDYIFCIAIYHMKLFLQIYYGIAGRFVLISVFFQYHLFLLLEFYRTLHRIFPKVLLLPFLFLNILFIKIGGFLKVSKIKFYLKVGLPGFEPGSFGPKPKSLNQVGP